MEIKKTFTLELYEAIYPVSEEQNGQRLDQFVQNYMPSFSREKVKAKIASNEVQILGRPSPHKPSVKVYYGEKVKIFTPKGDLEDEFWNGEKLELETDPKIVFEDDNIIAISKPPYMATHPSGRHLFNCATVILENKFKRTIYSIHRIDRETSGLLVLGKTKEASASVSKLFEDDLVRKAYFFISHENNKSLTFPFRAKERLGVKDNFIPRLFNHCFPFDSYEGKHAETEFLKIHSEHGYFMGIALPKTGRQHQIRSHASFHGLPLVGDKLYNGDPKIFMRFKDNEATENDHKLMELPRHALHALAIKFPYPSKDQETFIQTTLPLDFINWIESKKFSISINNLEEIIKEKLNQFFL